MPRIVAGGSNTHIPSGAHRSGLPSSAVDRTIRAGTVKEMIKVM
jgi:hypothetical protein